MKSEILCIIIDQDQDDSFIFGIAVDGIHRAIRCIYYTNCVDVDLYLHSPGAQKPRYIFLDPYHPATDHKGCLSNARKWYVDDKITVVIFATPALIPLFKAYMDLGIKHFLAKPTSVSDFTTSLAAIII